LLTIPFTDLKVAPIAFGTGGVGSSIDIALSRELLDMYIESGGNLIDTAHSYGDWVPGERSVSEKTIGRWMKERNNRHEIIISTKGCDPIIGGDPRPTRFLKSELLSDLDDSLKFLQTDYIDFYWIHKDEPDKSFDEVLDTLSEEQKKGKIRFYGCSNWSVERMRAADKYSSEHGINPFVGDQVFWNVGVLADTPFHSDTTGYVDAERYAYHQEIGAVIFAYQAQAFGYFNRLFYGTLDKMNSGFKSFYVEEEMRLRFTRMQKIMEQTGLTITQIVLGYLTGQAVPTIPIVGCQNKNQLRDSMTALSVSLTAKQIKFIETGE